MTVLGLRAVWTRDLGLLPWLGAADNPLDRLADAHADKALLLVLDNCEHLVTSVALLADRLLGGCPHLRILATSREPLGLVGEVVRPVQSLALPEAGDGGLDPALAMSYPAVQLFADRARAVRPGFAVDAATVGPVLRICRALDGMPLALELAAARLRALSAAQIAGRLDDRFQLLTGGSRVAVPRHQTLRAVVDWSWDLLSEDERVVARRLAVFSGGATLDAVAAACDTPETDVLEIVASLVDKSLVLAVEDGGGEARYTMLETMRAYGLERRIEAGEDDLVRETHARYFLTLAEQAEPVLRGPAQLTALDRLTAEHDNLHGALGWSIEHCRAELAVGFVAALGWYWFLRSLRSEAMAWAQKALSMPAAPADAHRVRALVTTGLILLDTRWDFEASSGYLTQAKRISARLDERDRQHPLVALLDVLAAMFARDEQAALERARGFADHPDGWLRCLAGLIAGQLLINMGEAGEAERQFTEALRGYRTLGERWGIANLLLALAEIDAFRGVHAESARLEQAREVFLELGDREDIGPFTMIMG